MPCRYPSVSHWRSFFFCARAPRCTLQDSKCKINARSVVFKIVKADSGPYWERLLRQEGRNVHCKVDWDNWKDEDEDEDEYTFGSQFSDSKDLQDMDFGPSGSSSDEDDADDNGGGASSSAAAAASAAASTAAAASSTEPTGNNTSAS